MWFRTAGKTVLCEKTRTKLNRKMRLRIENASIMRSLSGGVTRTSCTQTDSRESRNGRSGHYRSNRHQPLWPPLVSIEPLFLASQLPAICRDITPNIYPPSNYPVIHCACPSCCGTNAQPLFSSTYNSAPITRSGSSAYSSSLHSSRNVLQASYHPYPMAYESPYHSSSTSCSSHSPFFAVREMSKPENNVAALNWRRLHLSRAKLKASSRTSALLSGFAMVAMVEINLPPGIPEPLLIAFCVCTTLLVSVHMLALMISTCILPNLEAVASIHGIVAVNESPHEKMHLYIEAAWGFSTVFGILLFMAEIAIICWVVFIKVSIKAALAGTIILIPVVMLFTAFALHFYRNLVAHKFERSAQTVQELEDMVNQLQSGTQHSLGGGSQVLHV